MLDEHILKEMQLSFQLTEQREIASGRRKPENPQHRPAAPKKKVISKVASKPAKILKATIQKTQMESPKKSKKNKAAGTKRPLSNNVSKPDSFPSQKRLKKDDTLPKKNPLNKSSNVAAKKSAAKSKSAKLPPIPKVHRIESVPKKTKVKTSNNTKKASLPKKQKVNGANSSIKVVQNGKIVEIIDKAELSDTEMNSLDDWREENDYLIESDSENDVVEEIDKTFLKHPKILRPKAKAPNTKYQIFFLLLNTKNTKVCC
ncbi:GM20092 [Drosophila sechellia]|uniref:GM20092 n=1 Tax=Drosophila sechellia TaxID=7238 RepID=B4HSJ5_DROSE|nr:GM20092 [Drosophila sechellia]